MSVLARVQVLHTRRVLNSEAPFGGRRKARDGGPARDAALDRDGEAAKADQSLCSGAKPKHRRRGGPLSRALPAQFKESPACASKMSNPPVLRNRCPLCEGDFLLALLAFLDTPLSGQYTPLPIGSCPK
jgi:hypothetical protein